MVLVSVKMRNQISISAVSQFMNSVLRSKLTSAKRSESTVFELVFPDIEDIRGEGGSQSVGVVNRAPPQAFVLGIASQYRAPFTLISADGSRSKYFFFCA